MFQVRPILYQAKLKSAQAEVRAAQVELDQAKKLLQQKIVSQVDVALHEAKLAKAQAEEALADAELKFTQVRASFDGIIDRLHVQQGSLVKEGDVLTTMSDNSVMWVYFNVPESRYLDYMDAQKRANQSQKIELVLANHTIFPEEGEIGAIEANFNNETGKHSLPRRLSKPGTPVAARPDRHHFDQAHPARRNGDSATCGLRNPGQAVRLRA